MLLVLHFRLILLQPDFLQLFLLTVHIKRCILEFLNLKLEKKEKILNIVTNGGMKKLQISWKWLIVEGNGVKLTMSELMKSKFVRRPLSVRPSVGHQLSLMNLVHGFLSNFGSCFPWAICPDIFFEVLKTKNDFGIFYEYFRFR